MIGPLTVVDEESPRKLVLAEHGSAAGLRGLYRALRRRLRRGKLPPLVEIDRLGAEDGVLSLSTIRPYHNTAIRSGELRGLSFDFAMARDVHSWFTVLTAQLATGETDDVHCWFSAAHVDRREEALDLARRVARALGLGFERVREEEDHLLVDLCSRPPKLLGSPFRAQDQGWAPLGGLQESVAAEVSLTVAEVAREQLGLPDGLDLQQAVAKVPGRYMRPLRWELPQRLLFGCAAVASTRRWHHVWPVRLVKAAAVGLFVAGVFGIATELVLMIVASATEALLHALFGWRFDPFWVTWPLAALIALLPLWAFAGMQWDDRGLPGRPRRSVEVDLAGGSLTVAVGDDQRQLELGEVTAVRLDDTNWNTSVALVFRHGNEYVWGPLSESRELVRAGAWELAEALERPLQWHDQRE